MAFTLTAMSVAQARAEDGPLSIEEYGDFSIEALMDLEITSVSKRAQKLSSAAAAITVISAEDIRRSTATSIPELLRAVPGLHVARINSNQWAVSARGFNDYFVRQLLVVMDGRTLYSPLFGGVFWDQVDTVLEDIERIEVIRGPGGTLWGANAVNGVINIITKHAKDTEGLLAVGAVGTEDQFGATARYGGSFGEAGNYRAFVKGFQRDSFKNFESSGDAHDEWEQLRAGFRMEFALTEIDELTLQGNVFDGESDGTYSQPLLPDGFPSLPAPIGFTTYEDHENLDGWDILLRWDRDHPEQGTSMLQGYYDRASRDGPISDHQVDTYDGEFQHGFPTFHGNSIMVGVGYRYQDSDVHGGASGRVDFTRDRRLDHIINGFIQDDIAFLDDRLHLIFGTKVEDNDITHWEWQPNVRMSWAATDVHTLWGAVSRAVHTPATGEEDIRMVARIECIDPLGNVTGSNPCPGIAGGFPTQVIMQGNPNDLKSEELIAYELGYRARFQDYFSVDLAAFYNDHENILGTSFGGTQLQNGYADLTLPFRSGVEGHTYGVELEANWQVNSILRLVGGYTYQRTSAKLGSAALVGGDTLIEDITPHHQLMFRSLLNLPGGVELDADLRYVDDIKQIDSVGSYTEMDLRLGWQATENLELSLVGQNLLESSHREFEVLTGDFTLPARPQRGVYAKAVWTY